MTSTLKKLEASENDLANFSTEASMKRAIDMARGLERKDAARTKPVSEDRTLLRVPENGWLSGPGRRVKTA